jgi:hypothetical protein
MANLEIVASETRDATQSIADIAKIANIAKITPAHAALTTRCGEYWHVSQSRQFWQGWPCTSPCFNRGKGLRFRMGPDELPGDVRDSTLAAPPQWAPISSTASPIPAPS